MNAFVAGMVTVAFVVGAAGAQRPRMIAPPAARARAPLAQGAGDRARLEGEIRRGFARAVRNRVGLSEEQMTRLVPMTQRHEQQRRQIQMEERDARLSLGAIMRDEKTADGAQVDKLLQRLVDVQKRRSQLLETEQRDLATIMSPLQRAKFMALQEQIRRRLEQMRQRRMPLFEGDAPVGAAPGQRPPR